MRNWDRAVRVALASKEPVKVAREAVGMPPVSVAIFEFGATCSAQRHDAAVVAGERFETTSAAVSSPRPRRVLWPVLPSRSLEIIHPEYREVRRALRKDLFGKSRGIEPLIKAFRRRLFVARRDRGHFCTEGAEELWRAFRKPRVKHG